MNTQLPILNVAGLKNAALPAAQADSFSAEVPFNQVLNKEVSNRNNSNSDVQAPPQNQNKPTEAAKDSSPEPAKTSTAPANSSTPTKTSSSDDKQDDDQASQDDDSEDSTAASAQMLALVANLGQINIQPVARKSSEQDMDALASQKGGKKAIGQISADAKQELPAEIHAEDDGKTKGKQFSLGDLQDKQAVEEDAGKSKSVAPTRTTAEKVQPESPVATKAVLSDAQDAAAARSAAAKVAVEANVKPVEVAAQPNAATVVPTALQQAMSLSQQAALSGQAVQRLTPAVGSQGWDQAVGQKVLWMANGGLQSASLTLNPPDLGPLQVVLHVTNDHADATFITAQPEVKQALENAMPKLREMMDQAGIQLGQATVNTGTPNQQQSSNQQQARGASGSSGFSGGNDDAEIHVATVPVRPASSGGQGLVDTFA